LALDSEEGVLPGLGLIEGHVGRFRVEEKGLKVPHMGWNTVNYEPSCPLYEGFEEMGSARFYFVHSFHFQCSNQANSVGSTQYGYAFTSSVQKNKVFGVQFHPEKSHKFGMRLLRNFKNFSF
jgi:imidazole glycerol-phosphate synthase subunit HisH